MANKTQGGQSEQPDATQPTTYLEQDASQNPTGQADETPPEQKKAREDRESKQSGR